MEHVSIKGEKKEKEMLELASEPRRSFSKQTGEWVDESQLNREAKGRLWMHTFNDDWDSTVTRWCEQVHHLLNIVGKL